MINIIKPELLGNRLDADFYKKDFIENELILSNFGSITLSNLIDVKKSGYGVLPKSDEYLNNGLPLIRGGDLSFGRIQEIGVFVPEYYKDSRAIVKTGDVLILIKGACIDGPEGVARIGEAENGYLYNGSCYRLSFKQPELDGYFFIAYSQSKFFLKQKKRQIANTGISYNDESSILNYLVPNFSAIVKKYIGDKVRQAELLRGWAKEKERKVNIFHLTLIPKQDHLSFDKKFRSVKSFQMTERLDAHFYPSVVDDYTAENINSFQGMSEITSSIFNGQTQPEDLLGTDTIKQITVANLSSNFLMGEPRVVQKLTNSAKFIQKYDLLICNAAHNKSYIGKDITYIHSEAKLLPSTEIMIIRVNRDELPASYVRTYLNTKIGYIQIQSTVRGITAHSYPDDVKTLKVYIPKLCDQQREEWFLQDLYLAKAGLANEYSTKLVRLAKYLVEALIEGVLTEEELIQAQNALEQGDTSLDRDILSQMTEDGYAVAGSKPLFSDLDEFYDLLEQTKVLE